MPAAGVQTKMDGIRYYGGTVDIVDTASVPREERVAQLAAQHPDAYIASAYDDPLVIAGNSGLGHELAALNLGCDAIIVPVGGGGLSAGIITGLREYGDGTPVIGAEPEMANDAARSLRAGELASLAGEPPTIADGARVRRLGRHTWPILRAGLADIMEAGEEQIAQAVRVLFNHANLKSEPTGALGIAALLAQPRRFAGRRVCCVVTGGNADCDLFARIIASG
ncbi:MAG: pyridoxal-phosphate dependent enzyme [Candidatus Eremiobacteraeota bacterium]|nr:pyridoxal-phosphate dependent enzyme [Candidatus Eremiobacteraeota bacterium]